MQQEYFVAVHGGAGIHSRGSENAVKQALVKACKQAFGTLQVRDDKNAVLAATAEAIVVLENDPCLNAELNPLVIGYGSNLTLSGTVECDAAIMNAESGDFGSVGAVSGIANPIRLAHAVLEHARVPDPLGRIPPMTLVSEGATSFAAHSPHGPIPTVPPESLISSRAHQEWTEWTARLNEAKAQNLPHSTRIPTTDDQMQDTVGAVICDGHGRMAAGVSSGGILLKHPGRIGEAAVFGAGCWASLIHRRPHKASAEQQSGILPFPERSMACSVSGAGEDIIRAMLARTIARALAFDQDDTVGSDADTSVDVNVDVHEALWDVLENKFLKPCLAKGKPNPNAGVILLTRDNENTQHTVRLWCAFTTSSMAIAYASSNHPTPKAKILRRPANVSTELPIYITAISL